MPFRSHSTPCCCLLYLHGKAFHSCELVPEDPRIALIPYLPSTKLNQQLEYPYWQVIGIANRTPSMGDFIKMHPHPTTSLKRPTVHCRTPTQIFLLQWQQAKRCVILLLRGQVFMPDPCKIGIFSKIIFINLTHSKDRCMSAPTVVIACLLFFLRIHRRNAYIYNKNINYSKKGCNTSQPLQVLSKSTIQCEVYSMKKLKLRLAIR